MDTWSMVEVPVGAVLPYAGPASDDTRRRLREHGWMFCDGSVLYQSEYPELFDVIGRSYGYPKDREKDPGVFCIPDYRGVFMRGLGPQSAFNPEVDNRTSANLNGTGNTGAEVGSRQGEAIEEHEHQYAIAYVTPPTPPPTSPTLLGVIGQGAANLMSGTTSTSAITVQDSQPDITETRPVNIAVNFIIKCQTRTARQRDCCADDDRDTAPSSF